MESEISSDSISEIIENAFEFVDDYFDCSNNTYDIDSEDDDSEYFDADLFHSGKVHFVRKNTVIILINGRSKFTKKQLEVFFQFQRK